MLREDVGRYIAPNRRLGRKYGNEERLLLSFAAHAATQGEHEVHSETAVGWARRPSAHHSKVRLRVARSFAMAMKAEDLRHEILSGNEFADARYRRPSPFPLTREQIALLMRTALELPRTRPLTRRTWHCLIGLMAVTGMRVSEAASLRLGDLTADGMVIRDAKFTKSRLLPLHPSTSKALDDYLVARLAAPADDDHLFVTAFGRPPKIAHIRRTFVAIGLRCGLRGGPGTD